MNKDFAYRNGWSAKLRTNISGYHLDHLISFQFAVVYNFNEFLQRVATQNISEGLWASNFISSPREGFLSKPSFKSGVNWMILGYVK